MLLKASRISGDSQTVVLLGSGVIHILTDLDAARFALC